MNNLTRKILSSLFLIFTVSLYAQQADETSKGEPTTVKMADEKKTKVILKPGLELKQTGEFHVLEGKVQKSQLGRDANAIFEKTEVKAKLDIKINDLTLTPWVKERIGGQFNFRDDNPLADTEDTVNSRFRNRFYTGFTIAYQLDAIKLVFDNELRIESDLKAGKNEQNVDFRYAPVLEIKGDHDFGLWWGVKQTFGFHFQQNAFVLYDLDGTYKIGYTFWKGKDKNGVKFATALAANLETRWRQNNTASKTRVENEFFAGFKFKTAMVSPYIGYWLWSYDEKTTGTPKSDKVHGLKVGLSLKKGQVSFGMNYKGGINMNGIDFGKGWQNVVSSSLKVKF